jgi:hypothetical protein
MLYRDREAVLSALCSHHSPRSFRFTAVVLFACTFIVPTMHHYRPTNA